jgi:hypothetical protein
MAERRDSEVGGNERGNPRKSELLCKTGMISMIHHDQTAMMSINIAMRRYERSGNGRTDFMHTGWLGSQRVIKIVTRKIIDR